jgi:membrane protease YdiL (CAAX protease family)
MRDVIGNALLVVGGALIVVSGLFTLAHLKDGVVFTVLIPGFVFGLIMIGLSVSLRRRDHGRRLG